MIRWPLGSNANPNGNAVVASWAVAALAEPLAWIWKVSIVFDPLGVASVGSPSKVATSTAPLLLKPTCLARPGTVGVSGRLDPLIGVRWPAALKWKPWMLPGTGGPGIGKMPESSTYRTLPWVVMLLGNLPPED